MQICWWRPEEAPEPRKVSAERAALDQRWGRCECFLSPISLWLLTWLKLSSRIGKTLCVFLSFYLKGGMTLTYDPTPALQNGSVQYVWYTFVYPESVWSCWLTTLCLLLQVLLLSLQHCPQPDNWAEFPHPLHAFTCVRLPGSLRPFKAEVLVQMLDWSGPGFNPGQASWHMLTNSINVKHWILSCMGIWQSTLCWNL